MKYYSEVTKNLYETIDELNKAEKAITDKAAARKKDAAEVEKAYTEMVKARENYNKLLADFCSKHGAYHKTITKSDGEVPETFHDLAALVNALFN